MPDLPTSATSTAPTLTLVDSLRKSYFACLEALDTEVRELVGAGKEGAALRLFQEKGVKIIEIRETLSTFYGMFYRNASVLERFGSERLKQVGSELLPTCELLKGQATEDEIEEHVMKQFYKNDIAKSHWYIKPVIVSEIAYMLDMLTILMEPDFMPVAESPEPDTLDEQKPSRYIPPSVKLAVWQRDQGKCVQCGSNEKLEYDHIIPVSKGGSSTERNIQLLCEKCNREKSARIT